MTTSTEQQPAKEKQHSVSVLPRRQAEDKKISLLLPNKFISHHPKAGINPLVDAAAYLFSVIGKLKQLKTYRQLNKLHDELQHELHRFQEALKSHGYSSEYILASRYALCATLDDIISNTPWGSQGQWDAFSLLTTLNQEGQTDHERFFLILDRIIKDPAHYIDVMELMYICLSLGYKGPYRATEYSNNQLEQIIHALYKRIRGFRGDFSKALSPPPPKQTVQTKNTKKISITFVAITTASIIMIIFIVLSYLLDTITDQAYQELSTIGHPTPYETQDS